ncbi:hypothetical protein TEA_011243 [Camellia sinensis var. sinensis]|uniref:Uncharacterized protein n=1 Tax=Camellia sinensis var. sinensis TaxID=542762 RepID=A0A4S4CZ34_CAMSN|nr:hypothetical protein TEA_011243 [Camellia sinensis var. sinensis]
MPTSHQLAALAEVRSVRSSVVELEASEPLQSECPRPCSPVPSQAPSPDLGPPMRESGLLSGPPPHCTLMDGPPNVVGATQTHFTPSSEQYEVPCSAPYFVTEPSEVILPVSQPTDSLDPLSIRVQELSPSASPVRPGPPALLSELCLSKVFNCLSLKRPHSDDDMYESVVKKKLKGNLLELDNVSTESKALSVVDSKPPARVLARRAKCQRKTSLVEIQVQLLEADANSISGGTGPVRITSLDATSCCPRYGDLLGMLFLIKKLEK